MKWCTVCEKPVNPKRNFGGLDILLTILTGGIYLIFFFVKPKKCPMCNSNEFISVEKGRAMANGPTSH